MDSSKTNRNGLIFPNEIFAKIFKHLTFDDLMMVKEADSILDQVADYVISKKRSQIVLAENRRLKYILDEHQFFFTNEILDEQHFLYVQSYNKFVSNEELVNSVKMLVLGDMTYFHSSKWPNLIHLEIITNHKTEQSNIYLNLPKLQIFRLDLPDDKLFEIMNDTPSLKYLKLKYCSDELTFCFPETIVYLECDFIPNNILNFTNLQILTCREYAGEETIMNLPKLEQFNCQGIAPGKKIEVQISLDALHERGVKVTVHRILYELNFFRLSDFEAIDSYSYRITDECLGLYKRFLDRLEGDLWHSCLRTKDLDTLPSSLIERFTKIEKIEIIGPFSNEEIWIKLLKLKTLKEIYLFGFQIDQRLLDLIPVYAPKIIELELFVKFENLDFVLKLKQLEMIRLSYLLDLIELKNIVSSCQNLKVIEIYNTKSVRSVRAFLSILIHERNESSNDGVKVNYRKWKISFPSVCDFIRKLNPSNDWFDVLSSS